MIKAFNKLRFNALLKSQLNTYGKYALGEIVLVVLGILIALQINNQNELSKARELEKVYLKEWRSDIESNLESSKSTIEWIEYMVPRLMLLLEESAKEQISLPIDSLNYYLSLIQGMPTYLSTDRIYNNIIGSGDFKLIRSFELKNQIAAYYQLVDLIKVVQNTHELQLVNSYQPFILKKLDFQAIQGEMFDEYDMPKPVSFNLIDQVIHTREFRNIITLKLNILSDLLDQNKDILEANRELKALLGRLSDLD